MQRIRVGLIGLAAVVLLIGIASAIIGSATRATPLGNAAGNQMVNLTLDNIVDVEGEPLAELGAAPAPDNEQLSAVR